MTTLPNMYRTTQAFLRPRLENVEGTVLTQLAVLFPENINLQGKKIGITVGSRGIQNIVVILKAASTFLKQRGALPCFLAAMGSHGGGAQEGQRLVLTDLGITEESVGAPVVTETISEIVGHTKDGLPAFFLKSAMLMDGILVINRIKTHTAFKGKVESGLVKGLVVGLGGPEGARQFHGLGPQELPRLLVELGEVLLEKTPVLGGLAIIENAYEETADIQAVERYDMIEKEGALLEYSKTLMPSLPVDELDLLVVQEMGKNYSGTGIDTNIVGRMRIVGVTEPAKPFIRRIAVLDLSDESHGNATGIGLADFVTKRLVDKVDRDATYLNCLTSTFVVRAAIPMYFATEQQLLEAALVSLSGIKPEKLKIIIIPNTLYLTDMYVSEALVPELSWYPRVTMCKDPVKFGFGDDGKLLPRI